LRFINVGVAGMETAEMPAAVAAAGVPAADKSLTVGTVLDTGRTAGDGRTVTGA